MIWTERRQTPRMTVEGLAYVNLEPHNGGIILNISEGGLCFHCTTPVQQTATIRFWFSEDNPRVEIAGQPGWTDETRKSGGSRFIEAGSELTWTDKTRQRGGLRFTSLPAEGRKEIRNWISQHATAVPLGGKTAPSLPALRQSPSWSAIRQPTKAPKQSSTTVGVPSWRPQLRRLSSGFSGGLIAGVLVSALVASVFLLQTHRRELGQSLIHLGERLGGRSWPQPVAPPRTVSAAPRTVLPAPETMAKENHSVSPGPISVPRPERAPLPAPTPTPILATAVRPQKVKQEVAAPSPAPSNALPAVKTNASSAVTASTPAPPRPSAPMVAIVPTPEPNPNVPPATVAKIEPASQPSVYVDRSKEAGPASPSEKYLEVGRFNERFWADKTTDKLSQFGFSATIVAKTRLWKKSFQVLVGPYDTDPEAEAAHKTLASRGFTPRSFERGTREFRMPRVLRVGGTSLPVGDCVISWESYVPDAIVKFQSEKGVGVTVEGEWVKRDARYNENAVVYTRNATGSLALTEIRFSGMRQALVFVKGSM